MNSDSIINPRKEGYLIFAFSNLREIAFSELLQDHDKICFDFTLDFYLDRLQGFLFTKDLSIHRAKRLRKIARQYMKYEILYSESSAEQILSALDVSKYHYILIAKTDHLVQAYSQIQFKFRNTAKDGTYIRTRDIPKILKIYRTNFAVMEIGKLRAA
ncbi:MAG TPA: hypothetical protein PKA14_00415 [Leptospiraceae bacterium]|nr:hypothetical protein [Leptospiraceae bacterium]